MKILVTGATGFVGRRALTPLASLGHEIHAVYSKSKIKNLESVIWHQADLLDKSDVSKLLEKIQPTHLLHFAWYAEPGKFWTSIENYRWLESSISLLLSFQANGGERVVMAGTCAEYDWNSGLCSEYETPLKPSTPYGVCKNALQEVLSSYSKQFQLSSAWGRIFFLYGPGEHPSKLVASVCNSLIKDEIAACTHGTQIRDYMHVEDVASAFVALLNSNIEGPVNIASGQPVAIKDIVLKIADSLDRRGRVKFGEIAVSASEPDFIVADIDRLKTEVKWTPKYNLDKGIADTLSYWKEQIEKV